MSDELANFFPQTIAPPVALPKELEALHDFLAHQHVHASSDRELAELAQMSEKQLEAKIRELENWNFRLNLDEAKEIQSGIQLGILHGAEDAQSEDAAHPATHLSAEQVIPSEDSYSTR